MVRLPRRSPPWGTLPNVKAAATSPEVASRKLQVIAMPANLRLEIDFGNFHRRLNTVVDSINRSNVSVVDVCAFPVTTASRLPEFVDSRNDRILVRIKSRVITGGRPFLPSSAPMASRRNFIAVQSESITAKVPLKGRRPRFGIGALFNQTGMTFPDQAP